MRMSSAIRVALLALLLAGVVIDAASVYRQRNKHHEKQDENETELISDDGDPSRPSRSRQIGRPSSPPDSGDYPGNAVRPPSRQQGPHRPDPRGRRPHSPSRQSGRPQVRPPGLDRNRNGIDDRLERGRSRRLHKYSASKRHEKKKQVRRSSAANDQGASVSSKSHTSRQEHSKNSTISAGRKLKKSATKKTKKYSSSKKKHHKKKLHKGHKGHKGSKNHKHKKYSASSKKHHESKKSQASNVEKKTEVKKKVETKEEKVEKESSASDSSATANSSKKKAKKSAKKTTRKYTTHKRVRNVTQANRGRGRRPKVYVPRPGPQVEYIPKRRIQSSASLIAAQEAAARQKKGTRKFGVRQQQQQQSTSSRSDFLASLGLAPESQQCVIVINPPYRIQQGPESTFVEVPGRALGGTSVSGSGSSRRGRGRGRTGFGGADDDFAERYSAASPAEEGNAGVPAPGLITNGTSVATGTDAGSAGAGVGVTAGMGGGIDLGVGNGSGPSVGAGIGMGANGLAKFSAPDLSLGVGNDSEGAIWTKVGGGDGISNLLPPPFDNVGANVGAANGTVGGQVGVPAIGGSASLGGSNGQGGPGGVDIDLGRATPAPLLPAKFGASVDASSGTGLAPQLGNVAGSVADNLLPSVSGGADVSGSKPTATVNGSLPDTPITRYASEALPLPTNASASASIDDGKPSINASAPGISVAGPLSGAPAKLGASLGPLSGALNSTSDGTSANVSAPKLPLNPLQPGGGDDDDDDDDDDDNINPEGGEGVNRPPSQPASPVASVNPAKPVNKAVGGVLRSPGFLRRR